MSKSAVVHKAAALFALLWTTQVGCDHKDGGKREPPGSNAAPLAGGDPAETLYRDRCAGCHGPAGHGDGSLSLTMQVKPRDFTDPTWQAAATDEKVRLVILKGGKAIGASDLMPGSPDLEKRPEVLDPLVKKIRAFRR